MSIHTHADWEITTGRTEYEGPMRIKAAERRWDWPAVFGKPGKTTHHQEQGYLTAGYGLPHIRQPLQNIQLQKMKEIGYWRFTSVELAMGAAFDIVLMEDLEQKGLGTESEFLNEHAEAVGESISHVKDYYASLPFLNAFDSTEQPMWDSAALCDVHTLDDGSTVDNDLAASSLTPDTFWDSIYFLEWSQKNYKGLDRHSRCDLVVLHPSQQRTIWAILNQKYEVGETSAINDENMFSSSAFKAPKVVFNPDIATAERHFLGPKAKKNLRFAIRKKLTTEWEHHKQNRSKAAYSHLRLLVGVKDYQDWVGTPGA